ncbi:MAG: sulfatase-like hydrolase/transferase [Isosphaeraceae bacterium]
MLPHQPHNPPERLLAKYRDAAPTLQVARYWACVEWFDETVGALLDHLDTRGVAQDTLVVYLADNGWIQDPNADRYAPRSKQSPNEGGLRTPILLRWPGKIAPARSDRLAQSIDLMPTILRACGIRPPADLPGVNLLDHNAVEARGEIFGAIFTHNAVSLRDPAANLRHRWTISGRWKLILPDPRNEGDSKPELYDLEADPDELADRSGDRPEKVEALRRSIDAWWPAR